VEQSRASVKNRCATKPVDSFTAACYTRDTTTRYDIIRLSLLASIPGETTIAAVKQTASPSVGGVSMPSTSHIVDEYRGYAVLIPDQTPEGQTVTVEIDSSKDVHVLHAQSPDGCELYFEIATIAKLLSHETLIAAQHRFLREGSSDAEIGEPGEQHLSGRRCTSFDFRGELGGGVRERRFLFVDGSRFTYRVVFDPTSKLNELVIQSLRISD